MVFDLVAGAIAFISQVPGDNTLSVSEPFHKALYEKLFKILGCRRSDNVLTVNRGRNEQAAAHPPCYKPNNNTNIILIANIKEQ